MSIDLHTRAEAIAAGMTKPRWLTEYDERNFVYRVTTGPHEIQRIAWISDYGEPQKENATGIVLLANLRHELLAAIRTARALLEDNKANVTFDCYCGDNRCLMCIRLEEWKTARNALDAALARELGETP